MTPEQLAAADRRLVQAEARFARQLEIVSRVPPHDSGLAQQLLHELARALELMR